LVDIYAVEDQGKSTLMVAAYRGYADICDKLLNMGAHFDIQISMTEKTDYEVEKEYGRQSLDNVMDRAIMSGDFPTMEVIGRAYITAEWNYLKQFEFSDSTGFHYFSCPRLVQAAEFGMTQLCIDMIHAGIDINTDNSFESDYTPIDAAFNNNKMETAFVLAALGADISVLSQNEKFNDELKSSFAIVKKFFSAVS
jgi:ankyrin repeat protein